VASEDRLRELEEKYEDYKVYDNQGEKIGKVDDLFVDETDREEYIGVKMGFLGLKSTLIPMEIVRVNEGERTIEVSESKNHVRNAPSFDDDEDRIRSHFGLESPGSSEGGHGGYDDRSSADPEYGNTEESEESSEAGSSLGSTGSSTDETNREASTTRHTEETIQEDGRMKIRRRVIREEIIEDDDPKSQNN
jgi:sporulation protein YlmC with PRC-barrel domain